MKWYKLNEHKKYSSPNKVNHIIKRTKMESPFRMKPFLQGETYDNQSI